MAIIRKNIIDDRIVRRDGSLRIVCAEVLIDEDDPDVYLSKKIIHREIVYPGAEIKLPTKLGLDDELSAVRRVAEAEWTPEVIEKHNRLKTLRMKRDKEERLSALEAEQQEISK